MSDVAAIQNLVQKRAELKIEIAKIIVGQDDVIDQILLSIYLNNHGLNRAFYILLYFHVNKVYEMMYLYFLTQSKM